MNRNLTITIDQNIKDPSIVFINDISKIVNNSCDSIYIDCLEYLIESDAKPIVSILSDKLKPKGKLIISIVNAHCIASSFLYQELSGSQFLGFFKNKQNILSLDLLFSFIDFSRMKILNIDTQPNFIKLIIESD